jgi:hypothetical protein
MPFIWRGSVLGGEGAVSLLSVVVISPETSLWRTSLNPAGCQSEPLRTWTGQIKRAQEMLRVHTAHYGNAMREDVTAALAQLRLLGRKHP